MCILLTPLLLARTIPPTRCRVHRSSWRWHRPASSTPRWTSKTCPTPPTTTPRSPTSLSRPSAPPPAPPPPRRRRRPRRPRQQRAGRRQRRNAAKLCGGQWRCVRALFTLPAPFLPSSPLFTLSMAPAASLPLAAPSVGPLHTHLQHRGPGRQHHHQRRVRCHRHRRHGGGQPEQPAAAVRSRDPAGRLDHHAQGDAALSSALCNAYLAPFLAPYLAPI